MDKPFIIGIAGGSGSGKTTFARRLMANLNDGLCSVLYQDSYYIDQSKKFDFDGGSVNFDHPASLDFDLMGEHLALLAKGESIQVPRYDFASHTRSKETDEFKPTPIIIVDGILVLSQKQVFPHFNDSYFIKCPEEVRFERRLKRDVEERGRTPDGVKDQFYKQVKPMHDEFVAPSKENAAHIVSIEDFDQKLEDLVNSLKERLKA